jgi:translation initiation factor 2 subunit 2
MGQCFSDPRDLGAEAPGRRGSCKSWQIESSNIEHRHPAVIITTTTHLLLLLFSQPTTHPIYSLFATFLSSELSCPVAIMADVDAEKKRKSVSFHDEAVVVSENGDVTETATTDKSTAAGHSPDPVMDEVTDMFAGLAKKKKKSSKKKEGAEAEGGDLEDLDMSGLKKKKKKKPKAEDEGDAEGEGDEAKDEEKIDTADQDGDMVTGTGVWAHDLTEPIGYSLLLDRFFTLLHDRHPDLAGGSGKNYKIPPPQCLREGNKKTIFANIPDIAKRLKRSEEHLTSFLFAELGTSGSTDGSRRLVIRGRFTAKQIEMYVTQCLRRLSAARRRILLTHVPGFFAGTFKTTSRVRRTYNVQAINCPISDVL